MNISLQQLGIKETEDWYFGNIGRERANEILLKETVGVYLIRSSSQTGSFALSVRDNDRTNHYKIEAVKRMAHDGYKFKVGSSDFTTMPLLIEYYKKTKLGDSTLTVPATKPMYRAKYDFKRDPNGQDTHEDLPLKRNDCVYYLSPLTDADGTESSDWWRVHKRGTDEVGYVPAIYLTPVTLRESEDSKFQALRQLNFPFEVIVMRERNPNIFDATQLRLELNDIIEVQRASEQQPEFWYGLVRRTQKQGLFPFNYVSPMPAAGTAAARQASQSFRINRASELSDERATTQDDEAVRL